MFDLCFNIALLQKNIRSNGWKWRRIAWNWRAIATNCLLSMSIVYMKDFPNYSESIDMNESLCQGKKLEWSVKMTSSDSYFSVQLTSDAYTNIETTDGGIVIVVVTDNVLSHRDASCHICWWFRCRWLMREIFQRVRFTVMIMKDNRIFIVCW
jgi:hypothetical protein